MLFIAFADILCHARGLETTGRGIEHGMWMDRNAPYRDAEITFACATSSVSQQTSFGPGTAKVTSAAGQAA
jgi:hypothetical protein